MAGQHSFAQVPRAEIQRSRFDRSHGHKTTIDSGYLYPIFLDEALPGDTFNLKMHAVCRMATPIFPIMDNIYIDTQFFAVPMRLLWTNWEKFNGAQNNPGDSTDYAIPTLFSNQLVAEGSLGDYFGLPVGVSLDTVSCLPFRAYNLIYNEWYRDQNTQDSAYFWPGETGSAPEILSNYPLRRRGKRHDYFTSCLPWPQKGDAVNVPLAGGTIPVIPDGTASVPTFIPVGGGSARSLRSENGSINAAFSVSGTAAVDMAWSDTGLAADLTEVSSVTINTLRQAFQIQKILERDARGGTRYTEILKAHFGVTSPDARLQRPEYLGGFSQPVNISQIHQTSASGAYADTPLGQVGAIGTAVLDGNRNGFTASFTEHCLVIGLISVRADMTYQQRLDRMWSRSTRFDFYWPALAHIGEQAVLNKEIYYKGDHAGANVDNAVFGYQERYGEYRYKPSQVTGLFRSTATTPLDTWHLAYDFADTPVLNSTFMEENPPIDRVIAVPSEPQFIIDSWFDFNCARPMPMYGVPGLIDHF